MQIVISRYENNYARAVIFDYTNGENYDDYKVLSVNIIDTSIDLKDDEFFVDINNVPDAKELLKEHNIATPTGKSDTSGFVTYPVWKLTKEAIAKYDIVKE